MRPNLQTKKSSSLKKMMLPPRMTIAFFICAVCVAIVGKLVESVRRRRPPDPLDDAATIFVGIVSFCDGRWPAQIDELILAAKRPYRLFFGVVEFVRHADDSRDHVLPAEWRHTVRVHTVSERIGKSQRAARALCYSQLYQDESYVLFTRSIHPIRGWDDLITEACIGNAVLSTRLSRDDASPVFPCPRVKEGRLRSECRPLQVSTTEGVPSLLWQNDFTFSPPDAVPIILQNSDELEVSAALVEAGFALVGPGNGVGHRARHPQGLKCATQRGPYTASALEYARTIGLDVRQSLATPRARLGLTADSPSTEEIAKFGSIVAARVALQTAEAEERQS